MGSTLEQPHAHYLTMAAPASPRAAASPPTARTSSTSPSSSSSTSPPRPATRARLAYCAVRNPPTPDGTVDSVDGTIDTVDSTVDTALSTLSMSLSSCRWHCRKIRFRSLLDCVRGCRFRSRLDYCSPDQITTVIRSRLRSDRGDDSMTAVIRLRSRHDYGRG